MRNFLVWNKPEEEKHRDNRGEKKEIEITERAFVRKCGALFLYYDEPKCKQDEDSGVGIQSRNESESESVTGLA